MRMMIEIEVLVVKSEMKLIKTWMHLTLTKFFENYVTICALNLFIKHWLYRCSSIYYKYSEIRLQKFEIKANWVIKTKTVIALIINR